MRLFCQRAQDCKLFSLNVQLQGNVTSSAHVAPDDRTDVEALAASDPRV